MGWGVSHRCKGFRVEGLGLGFACFGFRSDHPERCRVVVLKRFRASKPVPTRVLLVDENISGGEGLELWGGVSPLTRTANSPLGA